MSPAPQKPIPRRNVLAGGLALLGLGVAALTIREWSALFGRRHKPTPFDDLLSALPDRENSIVLGAAVLAQQKSFDAHSAAARLRARIKNISLADAMSEDLHQGHLMEVKGWVLPETLTALCAIAARVS